MIKLYGISASRTLRPLWLLEEIGMEYEQIPVDFRKGENKTAEYLAINPNGKLPAMIDGDLVMFESMAINLYLAKQYGGHLYPNNEADIARTHMWSFWVMSEVEYDLLSALFNRRIYAEDKRDKDKADRAEQRLKAPFKVLDAALAENDYLLGENFSIADLNVAAVFSWCKPARVRLNDWPNIKAWVDRCTKREAFRAAIRKP